MRGAGDVMRKADGKRLFAFMKPSVRPFTSRAFVFRPASRREGRYNGLLRAKVAELVDALDLGSSGATRGSSSLPFRTKRYRF